MIGAARLDYPPNHIEVDNRLAWFLGRLDAHFGDDAGYIHLLRDRLETAQSFVRRYREGIIYAYRSAIIMGAAEVDPVAMCSDYVDTASSNIAAFLRDKTRVSVVRIESVRRDFAAAWAAIGARGDLRAALDEWSIRYNASP